MKIIVFVALILWSVLFTGGMRCYWHMMGAGIGCWQKHGHLGDITGFGKNQNSNCIRKVPREDNN